MHTNLHRIAMANPNTGRGFAAAKNKYLPKAMPVGRSALERLHDRPEATCTADITCDNVRKPGYLWCPKHTNRALQLGVNPPLDTAN